MPRTLSITGPRTLSRLWELIKKEGFMAASSEKLRKLSECNDSKGQFAFCPKCERFFEDDLQVVDKVNCPDCNRSLSRGFTVKGNMVLDQAGRLFRKI